jgi:signal peptidase I
VKFVTEISLVLLLAGLFLIVLLKQGVAPSQYGAVNSTDCDVVAEKREVRGNSLKGLIEPGDSILLVFGFYDCNPIARGDIVAFRHSARENPVIKMVRGVPGDNFKVKDTGAGWQIILNNQILKTTLDEPYVLNENTHRVLLGFQESYNETIPDDAYLLLGSSVDGDLDSTRFGLIHKSDIVGKVFK